MIREFSIFNFDSQYSDLIFNYLEDFPMFVILYKMALNRVFPLKTL